MDPLVCFLTPVVFLVYEDLVGVPEIGLRVLVVVEVVLVTQEVVVVEVEPAESRRKRIEYRCIQCNPVDELGFQIATQRCIHV